MAPPANIILLNILLLTTVAGCQSTNQSGDAQTSTAVADPVRKITASTGDTTGMVWIPDGQFLMGADAFADATPVHSVSVTGFWMDEHEVTNTRSLIGS